MRLHLSIVEFWALLPKEFYAITEEYGKEQKEQADLTLALEKMANWRMAMVCTVIANGNRKNRSDKKFKPKDFIPKYREQRKHRNMTAEDMLEQARMITKAMGGEVKI